MKSSSVLVIVLLAKGAFTVPAFAFQNGQHQNISQQAISNAGAVAPDIQKFGSIINSWSWGIGSSANLSTEQTLLTAFTIKGNPAEELAHLENQQAQMDATASINGGNYNDIVSNKVLSAFLASNFSNSAPPTEGAYVWMGAALHLIEDQASPPHGANIIHGVGDEFEGPLFQFGQKVKPFVFTSNISAGTGLNDLYNQCLAITQGKIPNFKNFSYNPTARLWLLNSELSGFGIDGSNGFGRYGGVILSPPLSDTPNFTQSAPADIYSEPSGPSIFTDQSTQAGDFATNFLIQMSKSLPPLVSELGIAGVPPGSGPAYINTNGGPITFRISENQSQAVTVNVYVQDTNQSIITSGDAVTLSSFRSADGSSDSTSLPGPNTWSSNQVSLFGTLGTDMTLLPFDGQLQLNWNGNVAGTPLVAGAHALCVTATPYPADASSIPSQPVCGNFIIAKTPPTLTVQDSYGTLPYYAVTTNNQISGTAVQTDAPVATLSLFQNGNASPLATAAGLPAPQAVFNMTLPVSSWYWVQACDVASNCALTAFCIDSPSGSFCNSSNVPPAPGAPPGGNQATPPSIPATLPSAHPVAGQPGCLSLSPNPATSVSGCLPVILAQIPSSSYLVAHDPNFMTGPNGSVTPGQLMTYTIEFENTGSGTALGVFIEDVLDPALDDTTLNLTSMFSLTFSSGGAILTTTPTSFPFTYDPQTRAVTVLAGNAGPLQGGSFVLQAKLRSTTVPGTIIRNQALVNFPNALEQVTPTNTIVSAVPLATQLANVGASSGTYLSAVGLAAQLTAGSANLNAQPIGFQIFGTSATILTSSSGTASESVSLSSAAGNYNLGLSFGGDGFYYLSAAANPTFTINTKATRLQVPSASGRVGDTLHLMITLTDDQGQAMLHQIDEPKTVYLEAINSLGAVTPLTSSLLSGTTVSFQFSLPQPYQLSWPLRARFGGDSHYAASISTGILSLVDVTPPVITIQSPTGGQFYNGASVININFSVTDESDPSPSVAAFLVPLSSAQPVGVTNGSSIPASSLAPGTWILKVIADDWAGNASQATTPSFQVTGDVLPPRTSLVIGAPSFSSSTLYATQATSFTLTAVDDLSVIGDGAGVGVAQTFVAIDTSVFSVYSGTFSLTGQGLHTIQFYSTDFAGNTEVAHSSSVAVDLTPPVTTLAVSSPTYSGFVSTATLFSLSAFDPVVNGVASGVALTQYQINGGAFVSLPTAFGLTGPDGVYTIAYQSQDNVGNQEVLRSTMVFLDATSPVTNLLVDGTPALSTTIAVTSTDTLSFAATDSTGSGVAATLFSLDGSAEQIFSSTFSLTIGTHTVSFQSRDTVGNIEALKSVFASVRSPDTTPPTLTLSPVNGSTVTTATPAITAVYSDTGTGVNIASFRLNLDGLDVTTRTVITASSATFTPLAALAQGPHTVTASVADNAGNLAMASSTFSIDSIAPVTTLVIGNPQFSTTTVFIATFTPLGFAVSQPAQTSYAVDAGSFTVFTGTFTLTAEGAHLIRYFSVDLAGNIENVRSSTVTVDATPPVTRLLVNGLSVSSAAVVVVSTDSISLSATDAGSGVSVTRFSLDGSVEQIFVSTFSLAVGTHTVAFQSRDNIGNLEALKTVFATVRSFDTTPPALTLMPVNGSTVTTATPSIIAVYSDTGTGVNTASFRMNLDGLDVTVASVVTASSAAFMPQTALAQGTHTVTASVADNAGNLAIASSTFSIDSIAPMTTLVIGSPQFSTTTVFIATVTPLGFSVSKPAQTSYAVDSGSFTVFTGTFTLTIEGNHVIRYFSVDAFGNTELVRSSTVTVDATPPVTRILVNGVAASSTTLVLVSTDALSFQATDAGSGVSATSFFIDNTPQQIFVSTFSLAIGTHTVAFQSRDNVNNIEALKSVFASVRGLDTTPPALALTPVSGSTVTTATPAITAVYSDTGTGVNTATFRLILDGLDVTTQTLVMASSATFIPASALTQGSHTAVASVLDFAGNKASISSTFLIDSIPPQTKLLVDNVTVTASSITVTSTDTFSFQATDSGTGVFQTLFSIDRSTPQVYQSTFSLVLGTHTVTFDSVDRAGNQESPKTVFVSVITSSNPVFSLSAAISPATLNLKSQGNFVMVVLQSTGAEISADIDTSTIRITAVNDIQLSTAIAPLASPPPQLGDANGDGILDLQGAFDRGALEAVLPPAQDQVKVAITGRFKDGVPFSSYAFIRTIGSLRTADLTANLSVDTTFRLGDVFVFPNPARAGAKPTFHIEAGIADSVEIKVYSVSGRLVMDSELSGTPPIIDSGSGARYAYEYVWDGHIASGVYLYVITAKRAGNKLTKTGKCAVVR